MEFAITDDIKDSMARYSSSVGPNRHLIQADHLLARVTLFFLFCESHRVYDCEKACIQGCFLARNGKIFSGRTTPVDSWFTPAFA